MPNDTLTLWEWRVIQGHELRNPARQKNNPPAEWFINQLEERSPGSILLWVTYSLKDISVGPDDFGFTDDVLWTRFFRYYRHLAKITGCTIEPYCFIGNWFNSLHWHCLEVWTPVNDSSSFEHTEILARVDRCFRKHFPSKQYPKHQLTKPRSKVRGDYIINSQTTAPAAGAPYYSRDGHNFLDELHRVFYP